MQDNIWNNNIIQNVKLLYNQITPDEAGDRTGFLEQIGIMPNQCMYAVSYKSLEVFYQRGITDLLGYTPNEFTFRTISEAYLHPKQKKYLVSLMNAAIELAVSGRFNNDTLFSVIYKVKAKDGSYKTMLRQSGVYEFSARGEMISIISVLTDLTDLYKSDLVSWKLEGATADVVDLKQKLLKNHQKLFSPREWEILQMLGNGFSSKRIADELCISKNTVDTHRRNMLKKAEVENTVELINFIAV